MSRGSSCSNVSVQEVHRTGLLKMFHYIFYKIEIYINFTLERSRQSVHNQTYMGEILCGRYICNWHSKSNKNVHLYTTDHSRKQKHYEQRMWCKSFPPEKRRDWCELPQCQMMSTLAKQAMASTDILIPWEEINQRIMQTVQTGVFTSHGPRALEEGGDAIWMITDWSNNDQF